MDEFLGCSMLVVIVVGVGIKDGLMNWLRSTEKPFENSVEV